MIIIMSWSIHVHITQVRRFIKQGVPDDMRGKIWNKMVGSQAIKAISLFDYQVIISTVNISFFFIGITVMIV